MREGACIAVCSSATRCHSCTIIDIARCLYYRRLTYHRAVRLDSLPNTALTFPVTFPLPSCRLDAAPSLVCSDSSWYEPLRWLSCTQGPCYVRGALSVPCSTGWHAVLWLGTVRWRTKLSGSTLLIISASSRSPGPELQWRASLRWPPVWTSITAAQTVWSTWLWTLGPLRVSTAGGDCCPAMSLWEPGEWWRQVWFSLFHRAPQMIPLLCDTNSMAAPYFGGRFTLFCNVWWTHIDMNVPISLSQ